jgi:hypothetical protein
MRLKILVVDEHNELLREPSVVRLGGWTPGAISCGGPGKRDLGVCSSSHQGPPRCGPGTGPLRASA